MLTKDDLKAMVDTMSPLIDARAKTTETLITGKITSAKEELEAQILASRAEAKVDRVTLQAKVVKRMNQLDERVEELEKEADIPHPHKH